MTRFTPLITALTLATPLTAADLPPAGTPEEAQIITTVSSITVAVDRNAYDLAEAAFAPEVVIDYTSVWGGDPTTYTPAGLMEAWRGIVPGFDVTHHLLGAVSVEIDGTSASATASIDGRHWIGDEIWRPVGIYLWDLEKIEGDWKVTRMVFDMTEELGDRALAAQAMERVASQ